MDVMLSDNLRRFLCRLGFVLLCGLPTMMCLKWAVLPTTKNEWSSRIQQQFGVINELDHVKALSPQRTDFAGLKFGGDRFASQMLIDTASLQIHNHGKVLHVGNARGSVKAIWATLQRMVDTVSWSGKSDRPVLVKFDSITFIASQEPQAATHVWKNVHVQLENRGQTLKAGFDCDEHSARYEVRKNKVAEFTRKRDGDASTWYLNAIGFRIPGWVLNELVPATEILNRDAEIADAHILLQEQNGNWSGELRGHFLAVELNDIVANQFGGLMSGKADVIVKSARIVDNKLHSLEGEFDSPSGIVGSQFLNACSSCLEMELVEPFGVKEEAYRDFQFGFLIKDYKISITSPKNSDAILNAATGAKILIPRSGQESEVSMLVRLFAWPLGQTNSCTVALASHIAMPPIAIVPNFEHTARQDEEVGGSFFDNKKR